MKIYFAGSIRGGREDLEIYQEIIKYLQQTTEVLTEHVGRTDIEAMGESELNEKEIHDRDMRWLSESDAVVAEVSNPSLGVGYEIAKAIELNKKVLCLYRLQEGKRLSAMIAGCSNLTVAKYEKLDDIKVKIDKFLQF